MQQYNGGSDRSHLSNVNRHACSSMWQCWDMARMENGVPGSQVVVLENHRNAKWYTLVTM